MKSLAKSIGTAFSVFFLSSVLILSFPIKTYAWEAHLNEDGDIEIYTVDKKRTSNLWYYTEGVTITRCKYNPTTKEIHESNLYFRHKLANAAEVLSGSTYYNTFTVSINDIISGAMQMDPAWAKEIQGAIDGTGPAVYIKLDCIMFVVDDALGLRYGPFVNVPEIGENGGNYDVGMSLDGKKSIADYGFDTSNGLKTHFNHYLLIGNGQIQEPKEYPDEHVTDDYTMDHYAGIDANQPAFAMSNYSSEFNLHDGIPSSEYIDNSFLADSWFGNTSVYARVVSQSYTYNITYMWAIDYGYFQPVDTNGDGVNDDWVWVPDIVPDSETRLLDIGTGYAAFQYLTDTHIYDFTNADIANGAYPGDHIYYDDSHEVPMTCISTNEYTDVAAVETTEAEEPNWLADTKTHVSMGTFTYQNQVDLGVVTQKPDIDARVAQDILAIRDIISRNTKTRNDKLVIDGHTFMNNDWVSGCNFLDGVPSSYTQCTQSAAWVHDYMMQSGTKPLHAYDPADVTGTEHVQIPPTVDNGQYPTSMKAYYQRLITKSRAVKPFEAD